MTDSSQRIPHNEEETYFNLIKQDSLGGLWEFAKTSSARTHRILHEKNNDGITALLHAAENESYHALKWLCEQQEVNVNASSDSGQTAFLIACRKGNLNMVTYLIETAHADATHTNSRDQNGLHLACRYNHLPVVRYILDQDLIDPSLKDSLGRTPLHEAAAAGHTSIVDCLFTRSRPIHQPNVNELNADGDSALILAVSQNHYDTAEYLLTNCPSIDVNHSNLYGFNAHMAALANGEMELIRLLEQKCDVNVSASHLQNIKESYAPATLPGSKILRSPLSSILGPLLGLSTQWRHLQVVKNVSFIVWHDMKRLRSTSGE